LCPFDQGKRWGVTRSKEKVGLLWLRRPRRRIFDPEVFGMNNRQAFGGTTGRKKTLFRIG